MIRENKPIDYIVGFGDLGNTDDFETEMLEWRIATQSLIEYHGDLLQHNQRSIFITKQNQQYVIIQIMQIVMMRVLTIGNR